MPFPAGADTVQHRRLLHLIGRYARQAAPGRDEPWVKLIPLLVLVHEGIVANPGGEPVFDYDYAPASIFVDDRRVICNVSQEGRDDIDDLREAGLIRGLKLTTRTHAAATAFQVSAAGIARLEEVPPADREAVDRLVNCPGCGGPRTVETAKRAQERDGGRVYATVFHLACPACGRKAASSFTEIEAVSYAFAPYLPATCRVAGAPFLGPAPDPAAVAAGADTIRDAELDVNIVLDDVRVVLTDYVPCGVNALIALAEKLGAAERIRGGLIAQAMDTDVGGAVLRLPPGLTEVELVDFVPGDHLNFVGRLARPAPPGVIQIKDYGVNATRSGMVLAGLSVAACRAAGTLWPAERLCLDVLARVLADALLDANTMLANLLSSYQQKLLELVYLDNEEFRNKFALITARRLVKGPDQPGPAGFFDRETYANELKQVIGDLRAGRSLPGERLAIRGRSGLLFVGEPTPAEEALLLAEARFQALHLFLDNFFNRAQVLADQLDAIRRRLARHEEDPNSVAILRQELSTCSEEVSLMQEVREHLQQTVEELDQDLPETAGAAELADFLAPAARSQSLLRRLRDLEKQSRAHADETASLQRQMNAVQERQMFQMQQALSRNTRNLEEVARGNERAGNTLKVVEIILAGALAFDILDRLTGEWSVMETTWVHETFRRWVMDVPFAWFGISLLLWLGVAAALLKGMHYLERLAAPVLACRFTLNRPCRIGALRAWLATKEIVSRIADEQPSLPSGDAATGGTVAKIGWEQLLPEAKVSAKVELDYLSFAGRDQGYVLSLLVDVARPPASLSRDRVRRELEAELAAAGVWAGEPA